MSGTSWSVGDFFVCPNCAGKGGFHNWPCTGGMSPYQLIPPNPEPGEERIRQLIREEIAKWAAVMPEKP